MKKEVESKQKSLFLCLLLFFVSPRLFLGGGTRARISIRLRPPFFEMLRTAALVAARRMRTAGGSAAAGASGSSASSSSSSSAAAASAVSSMLAAVGITGAASLALCEKTPAAAAAASAPSFDPEALERGAKALREINKSANAKQVKRTFLNGGAKRNHDGDDTKTAAPCSFQNLF